MCDSVTKLLGESFTGIHGSKAADSNLSRRIQRLTRLTYRKAFPEIHPYGITSDAGWGCMLRSAQMLLFETFVRHFFPSSGPQHIETTEDAMRCPQYLEILRWFSDCPGAPHYYSIHHLCQAGIKYDKLPGEWYGPSTVAFVLRDLAAVHCERYAGPLEVYVSAGDTIYMSQVQTLCSGNISKKQANHDTTDPSVNAILSSDPSTEDHPASIETETSVKAGNDEAFYDPLMNPPPQRPEDFEWRCALLVLVPILLGIEGVNPEYLDELKEVLAHPHCVGIIGGRTYHAMYFVGHNSPNNNTITSTSTSASTSNSAPSSSSVLLGLDPHTTYPAISPDPSLNPQEMRALFSQQLRVRDLETLPFVRMDPSMALGFYFRNRHEFESFCEARMALRKSTRGRYTPVLFGVEYMAPAFVSEDEEEVDHEGFDSAACDNESDDGGAGSDSGYGDRSPANRSDDSGKASAVAADDNQDDYVLV